MNNTGTSAWQSGTLGLEGLFDLPSEFEGVGSAPSSPGKRRSIAPSSTLQNRSARSGSNSPSFSNDTSQTKHDINQSSSIAPTVPTMAPGESSGKAPAPAVVRRVKRYNGLTGAVVRDSRDVVRRGEITEEEAKVVFQEVTSRWGFAESDEATRKELLNQLTLALVQSTSKAEENLATRFRVSGKYYELRVIADVMAQYVAEQDSYLRIFARSFEGGYFATRMYLTVRDAANLELRMELAARSDGPPEHAHYMIDVLDAVIRHSGIVFTAQELRLYGMYKANRTASALARANSVGLPTTTPDSANRHAREEAKSRDNPPQAVNERISFGAVR